MWAPALAIALGLPGVPLNQGYRLNCDGGESLMQPGYLLRFTATGTDFPANKLGSEIHGGDACFLAGDASGLPKRRAAPCLVGTARMWLGLGQ